VAWGVVNTLEAPNHLASSAVRPRVWIASGTNPQEVSQLNHLVFLDTAFTDVAQPKLLSLGFVTFDGYEHYVELDLDDPASAATLRNASDFARHCGVLAQWDFVPGSTGTACLPEMGQRAADWLQGQATRFGQPAQIAFDDVVDIELLVSLLRDTDQPDPTDPTDPTDSTDSMRELARPVSVGGRLEHFDSRFCADAVYEQLRKRGLEAHHALADAHALHAASIAVNTGKRVRL